MSSVRRPQHNGFPQTRAPVLAVALVKTLYALALACGTVEGENLESLKLNDYIVTNFFPASPKIVALT